MFTSAEGDRPGEEEDVMYPIHNEDLIHICIADRTDEIQRLKARRQASRNSQRAGAQLYRALAQWLSTNSNKARTRLRPVPTA